MGMEGNGNPTRKDNAEAPSAVLQLVITLDQMTGAVNVTGPINNGMVAYGMLESAKDAIRDHIRNNQSPIVRPGNLSLVKY